MTDETTKATPDVTAIATTEPTETTEQAATPETAPGPGLIQIERVAKKPRIEGLPVIYGGRYRNVPFAADKAVFAVDVVTARAAVRSGSFREVPGGKTRLK